MTTFILFTPKSWCYVMLSIVLLAAKACSTMPTQTVLHPPSPPLPPLGSNAAWNNAQRAYVNKIVDAALASPVRARYLMLMLNETRQAPISSYLGKLLGKGEGLTMTTTPSPLFSSDLKQWISEASSAADLQVGRVDFWNMPVFQGRSEVMLLRQYLDKDHRFRHGQIQVPRRGLIADFLPKGHVPAHTEGDDDPVGNSGWRNFSAFFGAENIREAGPSEYFPLTTREAFLWSFGGSVSRSFDSTDAIGTSADFAAQNVNVVFTVFVGGYYGDWNTQNNLLRAALGSGHVLSSSYSGLPHWHYQHMALGETLGFAARLTQANRRGGTYPPFNDGAGQVHIGLMGDPTLRMHPVLPPGDLNATVSGDAVQLTWTPTAEQNFIGYHVYRSANPQGPFQRVSGAEPIRATSFRDTFGGGPQTYMVRTIKREQSASGTYFNASQGVFVTVGAPGGAPVAPANLQAKALSSSQILLTWDDRSANETGFTIERMAPGQGFSQLTTVNANATAFLDRERTPGTAYSYRIRAFNAAASSDFSNTAQATTLPSSPPQREARAQFVQSDRQTQGNWTGRYGSEGYYVVTKEDVTPHGAGSIWPTDPVIPTYADMQPRDKQTYIWNIDTTGTAAAQPPRSISLKSMSAPVGLRHEEDYVQVYPFTTDPRALQIEPGSSKRLAAVWFGSEKFSIDLNIDDAVPHRVTFYFVDWDRGGRTQTVQISNPQGQVLDRQTVSNFENGVYYTWQIQGPVRIEFIKVSGPNALLMGTFFDPAGGATQPTPQPVATAPSPAAGLTGLALSASQARLTWMDLSNNETGFRIERMSISTRRFVTVGTVGSNTTTFIDQNLQPGWSYVYRVVAFNDTGAAPPSGTARVQLPNANTSGPPGSGATAAAQFVRADEATQGTWSGVYGPDGYWVVGGSSSLPSYARMAAAGKSDFVWREVTPDVRALQKSPGNSERVAGTWYSPSSFTVEIDLTDGQTHSVALYFLDWDRTERQQSVDIFDAATGGKLNSQSVTGFGRGKYYIWNLKGRVLIQITRLAGPNAVLAEVFFGRALAVTPSSGATAALRIQSYSPTHIWLRVEPSSSEPLQIESSTNLRDWTPLNEIEPDANSGQLLYPIDSPQRFFRAVSGKTEMK